MSRRHLALLAAALVSAPAHGTPDEIRAVTREALDRHVSGLSLPGAPPVYHLRYHVDLLHQAEAVASFGALLEQAEQPLNLLGVEVRVGDPSFDNTGYGGWEDGFGRSGLPDRLTPRALRLASWSLTDQVYKAAVEQYARKRAAFTPPPDHPGDYLLAPPTRALGPAPSGVDGALAAELARDLSSRFPRDGSLSLGRVHVAQEAGAMLVMDSEGTEVLRPHAETVVRAMAHARSADGLLVTDHRTWILRDPGQLPERTDLVAEVEALTAELQAVAAAPALDDEYVGPVVFEDGAALDLFRILLVPQLEGTPEPVPFESRFGSIGEGFRFSGEGVVGNVRLGRRVLPDGWTVVDDPRRHPEHPASFGHDLEGTPAQAVTLVTGGIVRTVLLGRIPRKGVEGSNGHARGAVGNRPAGRAAIMEVTPERHLSRKRMYRAASRAAAAYGRDWFVVVRRFQDDTVRGLDDSVGLAFGDEGTLRLPLPVAVVRRYRDGREEILRGATFAAVERWVLRDIQAAGPQVEGSWLAPFEAGGPAFSPIVGMPTRLAAPEVLVGEMELLPMPGDPRECPSLPGPVADGGPTGP